MRQGLRFGLAALVPVVALAVTMGASGSANRAVPDAVAHVADLGPSCYPHHEFTMYDWIGAFSGSSAGFAAGNGGDVSWTTNVKVTGNKSNTSGFFANPGGIAGALTATIHVPGVAHTIKFTSHCITSANVSEGLGGGLGEDVIVVAEGVVDKPPWSPGDNEALVYLLVEQTDRGIAPPHVNLGPVDVGFTLAHAKTCDTVGGQQYSFGLEAEVTSASVHTSFKGKGSGSFRGRAGLPAGVTPNSSPCPGIEYGN